MAREYSICPVCQREGLKYQFIDSALQRNPGEWEDRTHADDGLLYDCPTCGTFLVTTCDHVNLRSERQRAKWNPAQISALLRERAIRPLPPFWLQYGMAPYGPLKYKNLAPIDLDELLTRWPRSVPERLDRTLCNLAVLSETAGQRLPIPGDETALAFAVTPAEARFHLRCLRDQGYLDDAGTTMDGMEVSLTASGWQRYEDLRRSQGSPENPVFVAMWFGVSAKTRPDDRSDAEMLDLYMKAIAPAVEDAGYRVTRSDQDEHNEWIMDKVLGDIRIAPFVVADFTGNRNGVYFEAGFARGLGIQVIHTCHEDHLDQAHFDTKQLNHVIWKTHDELRERLYNRIMGSIGRGPHPARSS